jgi:hypothetical protein
MAKPKFNPVFYQNFTTNAKGELTYDDDTWNQINTRNEAIQKIERANQLKQQIQDETNAVILENQKEIARKSNIGMRFLGGVQTYSNPRNWAKGVVGFGGMLIEDFTTPFISGSKAWGEQNAANNLYNQSKDLADQANKIIKTDRPQAEALLKQSQALFEEANKFAGGEATKKIMGADDKLTGKEIFAKSALAGITAGSFAPIGGVLKGSFALSKTVPAAVQGSKTVVAGNLITRSLGLGDIYQVTKTGVQQGLKQEVQQTIVGQAVKSTFQAPLTAGLIEMADDDGVNNYWGSFTTTAAGAFGLTLGFGYAGRVFGNVINEGVNKVSQQLNKTGVAAITDLTAALPTPPEPKEQLKIGTAQRLMLPEATQATTTIDGQQVGLPTSPYSKLGAFDPKTTIPMVDLTETVKGNNIDFNPDSVLSINSARKVVDDLALLNGNEVGGRKLKINTDDPKYQEVYNTQIKPLIDKINAVDEVAFINEVSFQDLDEVKIKLPTGDKTYKLQYKATNTQKELISQLEKEKNVVFKLQTEWEKEYKKIDKDALDDIQRKITDLEEKDTSPEALAYKKIVSETEFLDPKQDAAYEKLSNKPEYKVLWDEYKNIKKRYNEIYQEWENKSAKLRKLAKQYYDTNPPSSKEMVTRSEGIYGKEYEDQMDFDDWYIKYSEPTNVPDVVFDIAPVSKNLGDEFQPKYIPTEPGKAPSFKKWLEFQSGWVDYTKNPDLARYYSSFQTYDPELKPQEIKKVLKNWDTFDEDSIDGFEIDENEGIWWVKEKDFMMSKDDWGEYTISNYFDKKTDKEFGQLIGEKFDTREKAKARLKELLEFKLNNKTAWNKAKKEIGKENKNESLEGLREQYEDDLDEIIANNEQLRTQIQVEAGQSQLQVNKIPAEEVELEVRKIYNTLENEGFNIVPEKVRYTPNIDKIDDKQAKGEQFTPEEFEQGMKEYVNSTGKTEVIDGVQEELTGPMKKSAYVERLNRENPGLNLTSVQYKSAVVKDLEAVANDLIENNFDEAARIARNINANSNLQEIKTAELYINKLIELGKKDELAQVYHTFSRNATSMGQKNGILEEKKIGSPQYAIKQAQEIRMNKLKPDIDKEVAKVKQQMSLFSFDQISIFDILDNITCQ